MSEKEKAKQKNEEKIKEIKDKGHYVEVYILADKDKKSGVVVNYQEHSANTITVYKTILALKELTKTIEEKNPEIKLLDLFSTHKAKTVTLYDSEYEDMKSTNYFEKLFEDFMKRNEDSKDE